MLTEGESELLGAPSETPRLSMGRQLEWASGGVERSALCGLN